MATFSPEALFPSASILEKLQQRDVNAPSWIADRMEKIAETRCAQEKMLFGVPKKGMPAKIESFLDALAKGFNSFARRTSYANFIQSPAEANLSLAKTGNDMRLAILEYISAKNSPVLNDLSTDELASLVPLPVTEVELQMRKTDLAARPQVFERKIT